MLRRGLLFLFTTLVWTWLFWFTIAFLGKTIQDSVGKILYYVGGAGPLIITLVFLYLLENKKMRGDFWNRLLKIRAIQKRWIFIALLLPVILNAIAIFSTSILAGELTGYIPTYVQLSQPMSLLFFFVLRFILGPLPEEIGWRGYALDRVQMRINQVVASLIIWLFWWLWHLPLYFIEGTYQNKYGLFSEQFFVFALGLMAESFLFTWLYNKSARNIFISILFHFSINATGELLILNPTADLHRLIWSWIVASVVIYHMAHTNKYKITAAT